MVTNLEIVNLSDVGRKRPHNEDSTVTDLKNGLVVLADGMGGYNAGEVASAIAVVTILEDVSQAMKNGGLGGISSEPGMTPESSLIKKAIIHANSNIYSMAMNESQCQGMGTTVVTGLFYENKISIGNVGDSRLYRLREGKLQQLTEDHSLMQELINRGLYTPEEAEAKTPKNLVTRALGLDDVVEVDIFEDQIKQGDIYLLCSDGLNDMVNDEEIHLTLSKYSANLVRAAEELVQFANNRGGKDNISIVLVRIKNTLPDPSEGGQFKRLLSRLFVARG